jgi:hypothetical protein
MELWIQWFTVAWLMKPAFSRWRSFLWFVVCLIGITIREDTLGVTSIVRTVGLKADCYDRILDFFHSNAFNLDKLTRLWTYLVLKIFTSAIVINGRILLVGDGLKVPKEGKKMPAVKSLHQESESNSKPEYIMGHSCQSVAILVGALQSVFAVPLASRIHEGVVFSNRDKRTLIDKFLILINTLGIPVSFYFIADAFYANRKFIHAMLSDGNHLISRVKSNTVAYHSPSRPTKQGKGRPKTYGDKVKLTSLFNDIQSMETVASPVYGETKVQIRYTSADLLIRPLGKLIRFVAVVHPSRGSAIYMSTDLSLSPVEIIRIYSLRFKIEVSFKQSLHTIGTYSYHFWMKKMKPLRRKSGNQHQHRNSKDYRDAVKRKIEAYHRHIQVGIIAHGLAQYLATAYPELVWKYFGSWLRTIRPDIPPSEHTTVIALRNTFFDFFATCSEYPILMKFLTSRINFSLYKVARRFA